MKKLVAGKTGSLKTVRAKAAQALSLQRVSEGIVESPDIAVDGVATDKVRVKVHAPATVARVLKRKL